MEEFIIIEEVIEEIAEEIAEEAAEKLSRKRKRKLQSCGGIYAGSYNPCEEAVEGAVMELTGDVCTYLTTVKTISLHIHMSTECREHASTRGNVDGDIAPARPPASISAGGHPRGPASSEGSSPPCRPEPTRTSTPASPEYART